MVCSRIVACVALCIAVALGATTRPSHEEVVQMLKPKKDLLRSFIVNRVIGGNPSKSPEENALFCSLCQLGVTLGYSFIGQGSYEEIQNTIINLCIEVDILAEDICDGIIKGFMPHLFHIVTHRTLAVNDICGVVFQNTHCVVKNQTMLNWDIEIAGDKPPPASLPPLPDDVPVAKILHLTDIHTDLGYVEGSLTDCGKPMCCRTGEHWDEPWNSSVEAGHFGDYHCDVPEQTVHEAFLNSAQRNTDYEFVILGGDYVHHGVWFTTKEDIIRHFESVANSVLSTFPTTPLYPVIGNHESHPTNVFPPSSIYASNPEFDQSWVYKSLANLYSSKLPPDALDTFRKAGYYTLLHKPGLRIITLNTQFCYGLNFWILYEPIDPEGQLQWFSNQMHQAEINKEKVFILGHIPPGVDHCWSPWNAQFNRVIDRYQNLILGMFYGHTHNDDFKIFFNGDTPTTVAHVSPSITTYTDVNPGYKVFLYDGIRDESTWELIDYEVFTYNLTQANLNGKPEWYKLYAAREAYGLQSLRPKDFLDFVLRMAEDPSLFQRFYNHYNKNSDSYDPCSTPKCIREALCQLLTANDSDKSQCQRLDSIMKKSSVSEAFLNYNQL